MFGVLVSRCAFRFDTTCFVEGNRLPKNLNESLVFDTREIDALKKKIAELDRDKAMQKKAYKDVRLLQVGRPCNTCIR